MIQNYQKNAMFSKDIYLSVYISKLVYYFFYIF